MAIPKVMYIYSAIGVVSLLANITQIISMVIKKRTHTVFEISLLSLCIADMLSALTMSAYGLYIAAFKNLISLSNMKYLDIGLNTTITIALTTLNVIAVQRLLDVFPNKFKTKLARHIFHCILAATWVVPILYGIIGTLLIRRDKMLQINAVITLLTCAHLILQHGIIYYFMKSRPAGTTTHNRESTRSFLIHSALLSIAFICCFAPLSILIFLERFIKRDTVSILFDVSSALIATNPFIDATIYFFVYNYRLRRIGVTA